MTPSEFWDACERHDWTYSFSDDHRVWRAGQAERDSIDRAVQSDPALEPIFMAWRRFIFSGPAYGTVRPPRPVREDFIPPVSTFPGRTPEVSPDQGTLLD